jgi:hypothetical protein
MLLVFEVDLIIGVIVQSPYDGVDERPALVRIDCAAGCGCLGYVERDACDNIGLGRDLARSGDELVDVLLDG